MLSLFPPLTVRAGFRTCSARPLYAEVAPGARETLHPPPGEGLFVQICDARRVHPFHRAPPRPAASHRPRLQLQCESALVQAYCNDCPASSHCTTMLSGYEFTPRSGGSARSAADTIPVGVVTPATATIRPPRHGDHKGTSWANTSGGADGPRRAMLRLHFAAREAPNVRASR